MDDVTVQVGDDLVANQSNKIDVEVSSTDNIQDDIEKTKAAIEALNTPQPEPTEQETPPDEEVPSAADPLAEAKKAQDDMSSKLAEKDIDFGELYREYLNNGQKLTDATAQRLAEAGFSVEMQRTFIAGQEAIVKQAERSLHSLVGSEKDYNDMFVWAGKTLDKSEQEGIVQAFNGGDMNTLKLIISGLSARWKATQAPAPARTLSGSPKSTDSDLSVDRFHSREEAEAAFRDKRYATDPAYRAEVVRRFQVTMKK